MFKPDAISLSIVIPTYRREQVLLNSLEILLNQTLAPAEIFVVDQTAEHENATERQLTYLAQRGQINWIRLNTPSIPGAMNIGLKAASHSIVLFLDDDICATSKLVAEHMKAYQVFPDSDAVAGQVLQPGQAPLAAEIRCQRGGLLADLEFPFYSVKGEWVRNVMAGNLSVKRDVAIAIGGFDENFSGVAYRFETDFARRLIRAGGKIRFYPDASIHHLQAATGGTRSKGTHLTSASPSHGIGDYYFAFLHGEGLQGWRYSLSRFFREVRTRFHLQHPWWIPVKMVGEFRALIGGYALAHRKLKEAAIVRVLSDKLR